MLAGNLIDTPFYRFADAEIIPVDGQEFIGKDGVIEPLGNPYFGGDNPSAFVLLHRPPSVYKPKTFFNA